MIVNENCFWIAEVYFEILERFTHRNLEVFLISSGIWIVNDGFLIRKKLIK